MSRQDPHDLEFPPGLGFLRPGNTHSSGNGGLDDGSRAQTSPTGSYPGGDRRASLNFAGIPLYAAAAGAGRSLTSGADWDQSGDAGPNRPNPPPFAGLHPHHHQPAPAPLFGAASPFADSAALFRPPLSSPPALSHSPTGNPSTNPRATLWWGDLEPWMDEEYAKQVCTLMAWDPTSVKVPHPPPDPATGQQANNPGYCFLSFPSPAHAAAVLAQVNNPSSTMTMPNSNKPFSLNWAANVPTAPPPAPAYQNPPMQQPQTYQKEYSIFVGDLAPETSNSDLVAVFRNPVLGLRNDREPKFIRPFLSCKSAKIMLDPVTGVSRGYGFVRFTDERDQQRALIEMHGLYCLSRPMRISPATAKFKPPTALGGPDMAQMQYPQYNQPDHSHLAMQQAPQSAAGSSKNVAPSVSAPIAATGSGQSLSSVSSSSSTSSGNPLSAGSHSNGSIASSFTSANSEDLMNLPTSVLAQIAQQYANSDNGSSKQSAMPAPSITAQFAQDRPQQNAAGAPGYVLSEESWKHHAQARAILGNLIGPNGEQLTSTDPYNTTVFVGGLSPLISEDTLRTFFAPFGDIHYVKVPVGKHCGFVQFVRKADAERAIEKMQGFPVGGSRIRLSWGRSQYKAAQAAAQAAQAAALQQFPSAPSLPPTAGLTQEQALQLLQKFAMQGYISPTSSSPSGTSNAASQPLPPPPQPPAETAPPSANVPHYAGLYGDEKLRAALLTSREDVRPFENYPPMSFPSTGHDIPQRFSPFSPDPNMFFSSSSAAAAASGSQATPRGSTSSESLPHPSKAYAPGFFSPAGDDVAQKTGQNSLPSASTSPPSSHTPVSASATGFGSGDESNGKTVRHGPISRPASGQPRLGGGAELDPMQDLNGTLASLDLDRDNRPWKSPAESSESSGSVQFRMTPSP